MRVVGGDHDGLEALLLPSADILQILMEGNIGRENAANVN